MWGKSRSGTEGSTSETSLVGTSGLSLLFCKTGRLHEVISSLSFRDVREDPLSKGGTGRADAERGQNEYESPPTGGGRQNGGFQTPAPRH